MYNNNKIIGVCDIKIKSYWDLTKRNFLVQYKQSNRTHIRETSGSRNFGAGERQVYNFESDHNIKSHGTRPFSSANYYNTYLIFYCTQ